MQKTIKLYSPDYALSTNFINKKHYYPIIKRGVIILAKRKSRVKYNVPQKGTASNLIAGLQGHELALVGIAAALAVIGLVLMFLQVV